MPSVILLKASLLHKTGGRVWFLFMAWPLPQMPALSILFPTKSDAIVSMGSYNLPSDSPDQKKRAGGEIRNQTGVKTNPLEIIMSKKVRKPPQRSCLNPIDSA